MFMAVAAVGDSPSPGPLPHERACSRIPWAQARPRSCRRRTVTARDTRNAAIDATPATGHPKTAEAVTVLASSSSNSRDHQAACEKLTGKERAGCPRPGQLRGQQGDGPLTFTRDFHIHVARVRSTALMSFGTSPRAEVSILSGSTVRLVVPLPAGPPDLVRPWPCGWGASVVPAARCRAGSGDVGGPAPLPCRHPWNNRA